MSPLWHKVGIGSRPEFKEYIMKLKLALAMMFVFGMGTVTSAQVTNGSFEDFNCGTSSFFSFNAGTSAIPGWTVGGGGVDVICSYWTASDGSVSLDLNNLSSGSVSQDITTVAGVNYAVTFDMSGNPDGRPAGDPLFSPSNKTIAVNVDGSTPTIFTFDTTAAGNTVADMMWLTNTFNFMALDTLSTLSFASLTAGAFGPALDNVRITVVGGTVCHRNKGKAAPKTMTFTELAAFEAHIGHGDTPGPCATDED